MLYFFPPVIQNESLSFIQRDKETYLQKNKLLSEVPEQHPLENLAQSATNAAFYFTHMRLQYCEWLKEI
jgi:hypothetical protein